MFVIITIDEEPCLPLLVSTLALEVKHGNASLSFVIRIMSPLTKNILLVN